MGRLKAKKHKKGGTNVIYIGKIPLLIWSDSNRFILIRNVHPFMAKARKKLPRKHRRDQSPFFFLGKMPGSDGLYLTHLEIDRNPVGNHEGPDDFPGPEQHEKKKGGIDDGGEGKMSLSNSSWGEQNKGMSMGFPLDSHGFCMVLGKKQIQRAEVDVN